MIRQPAVLLISPGILKWTDLDFGLPHLVSIGGYLQAHLDVRVELLDLNYEGGDPATLRRTLESLGPYLLIGVSCYSSYDYLRVMSLARFLRRLFPDVPLVTGGYHASALPQDLLFEGSPFDAVVAGEGERPVRAMVETLLGGGRIEPGVHGPDLIDDLDTLPPYRWELLARYWPRAHEIGRKLQVYLSRGCPYHCTFCMERAKSGYQWRAYSAGRAVEELRRLATFTDLGRWVVNLADPLFGLKRSWRREVLEGILRHQLLPRQYWTLTRADDLSEDDVDLMARARFSIGIGVESGSPDMLRRMQKGNTPERYLAALERLAGLSRQHGLNWAANIIVGHPGETHESMRESHAFLQRLFTAGRETCGWLSIDPFRLYPGSQVHEQMAAYSLEYGTRFHHPEWWKSWYDGPFRAEHVDPSHEVDFAARVRFMYDAYGPLVQTIIDRFRGQGRSVDRVFERSLREQADQLSPRQRDALLARGARAARPTAAPATALAFPIGLHVRDPWVRRREKAVRRLLEAGALRSDTLIEAFLTVAPERYLGEEDATALLRDEVAAVETEDDAPRHVGLRAYVLAFEALQPGVGDRVADLTAETGYVAALLAELVGPDGEVFALHPPGLLSTFRLRTRLAEHPQVQVHNGDATTGGGLIGPFDALWLGGALPRFPRALTALLHPEGGRAATFLGPRFRPQDLVCVERRGDDARERALARLAVPVLRGAAGWLRS